MIIIYDYLLPSLLLLEKKYLLVITNKPSSCEISELKLQQISEIVTASGWWFQRLFYLYPYLGK